jgi:hypothetical protein
VPAIVIDPTRSRALATAQPDESHTLCVS